MRADRLLSILLLLQTREQVSAPELAKRLEVSVRTVYRDVEALSAAGVPVWSERGRHGGIRLLPGYRTDVTGLTADEARALFVLATTGTHADLGLGGAIGSALRKVMAALPDPHRPEAERVSTRVLVDPKRWMRPGEESHHHLAELQHAVFTDRRARLVYRAAGRTEPRTYTVDPYGLVCKAGVWYLVADRDGAPRLFRVDRVLDVAVADDPVRLRPGVSLADMWAALRDRVEQRRTEVEVVCRVRRARLDMFLGIMAAHVTEPPVTVDDAWCEVRLGYRALGAARPLLAFGTDVLVLTPPEVRADLAAVAAAAVAQYDHPADDVQQMSPAAPPG